jgi:chemotaxis-related protein WspD
LPHRQRGAVLGLANVRGELLICVSLGHVIGVEPSAASPERRSTMYQRLLVIRRGDIRVVCPVDEVHGIHRVHPRELKNVPTTVSQSTVAYSIALLSWRDRSVGILDDQLVLYSIKRSLE